MLKQIASVINTGQSILVPGITESRAIQFTLWLAKYHDCYISYEKYYAYQSITEDFLNRMGIIKTSKKLFGYTLKPIELRPSQSVM